MYATVDHLGTPRLWTDSSGQVLKKLKYYPFGKEATPSDQGPIALQFTGHERDANDLTQAGEDIDYMHARNELPGMARLLSLDPSARSVDAARPGSLNRYLYALGNPLKYVDPTGALIDFANEESERAFGIYRARLGKNSIDLANIKMLEASEITYVINVEDTGRANEGSVSFNEAKVFLNVDPVSARGSASVGSRLAHEIQHGVQVETGAVGFRRGLGGWNPFFTDVFDEVEAWDAQLRQASGFDLFRGNLRGYANASDRAAYLINHGYGQYRDRERRRVDAPTVQGLAPGTLFATNDWFYRIPR